MIVAIAIVILSIGLISYVYIGYPLLLWGLSRLSSDRENAAGRRGDYLPTVTLIIAAYNEEEVIAKRIENALALDYPRDMLEIIVFSDGSTDGTDEIVRGFLPYGVELIRVEGRRGKTYCQDVVAQRVESEVMVFSDANSMYRTDTLRNLVRHFDDSSVGAVGGLIRYVDTNHKTEDKGENLYLHYESALKKMESQVSSVVGLSGSVYAVAKKAYVPLTDSAVCSDFVHPLLAFRRGYRVVYDPEAICFEQSVGEHRALFARKKRIINRAWVGLWSVSELLNPFEYGVFAIQLISHKLMRWFVPFFFISLFVASSCLLRHPLWRLLWGAQSLFYLIAVAGYFHPDSPAYPATYFFLVNFASLAAVLEALLGKKEVARWETAR